MMKRIVLLRSSLYFLRFFGVFSGFSRFFEDAKR